jgi:hypothetical protein
VYSKDLKNKTQPNIGKLHATRNKLDQEEQIEEIFYHIKPIKKFKVC